MARVTSSYSSPSLRRASRPLSMISENPDDPNGKVQWEETKPESSPKLSRPTKPTRKKSVAPLQHPVTALLDSYAHANSNIRSTASLHVDSIGQNRIPDQQSTFEIKSLFPNNRNQADNNKTEFVHSCVTSSENGIKNTETPLFRSTLNIPTSKVITQSEVLDKNHNPAFKTSFEWKENRFRNFFLSSPDAEAEHDVLKAPSFYLGNDSVVENLENNNNNNNEVKFGLFSNDDLSYDSTSDGNVICEDGYNSEITTYNSNWNSKSCDLSKEDNLYDSGIFDEISNYNPSVQNSNTTSETSQLESVGNIHSHYNNIITKGKTINAEANPEVDVYNTPKDFIHPREITDFKNPNLITSTPIENGTRVKPSQHTNHTQCHDLFQHSQQPNRICFEPTTPAEASSIATKVAIRPPAKLRHNQSEPNMLLKKTEADSDFSNLDKETVEWKRRVKRSISLIKIPLPQEKGIRRRISSINLSSQYNNTIDENLPSPTTSESVSITSKNKENENNGMANQSKQEPVRRISAIDQSDFSLLKFTANRLNLPTRRESVTAWKEKYMNGNSPFDATQSEMVKWSKEPVKKDSVDAPGNSVDNKEMWELTDDVKNRINGSLAWLRQELINIRLQDQSLARQFLTLRNSMNAFRLAVECEGHQELIDDAEEDIEEIRELSQLVDIPPEIFSPLSPLKHVGITRMNISSRRFSTC